MMTPQLFINYKLKSVAHLPWRMLTYKALNTFIDDLFAFVIKMPMLYRLGCFRDGQWCSLCNRGGLGGKLRDVCKDLVSGVKGKSFLGK